MEINNMLHVVAIHLFRSIKSGSVKQSLNDLISQYSPGQL